MMGARTVYATVQGKTGPVRMNATVDAESGRALVGYRNGETRAMLGWYNLDRFEDGKVTERTLQSLFSKPAESVCPETLDGAHKFVSPLGYTYCQACEAEPSKS